jgi:hypothetical protein
LEKGARSTLLPKCMQEILPSWITIPPNTIYVNIYKLLWTSSVAVIVNAEIEEKRNEEASFPHPG